MKLGVLGASGFIGSRVVAAARHEHLEVAGLEPFRVGGDVPTADLADCARRWEAAHRRTFDRLCQSMSGFDVVVNAAGLPQPESARARELFAANAVHPAIVALAAREAGVRRLVHVSSAVVQGRLDPLDESPRHFPLSPYSASKAEAEKFLLEMRGLVPAEVVIYRPTSVQDPSRATTRTMARLASTPAVPVVGNGEQPVPVALAANVVAGIVFAAHVPSPPEIALQPSEGMTVRRLVELLARGKVVSLPPGPAELGRKVLVRASAVHVRATAVARRVELMLWGQNVDANALAERGFVPPVGPEGWEDLAVRVRNGRAHGDRSLTG